jgi:hypothetical protein
MLTACDYCMLSAPLRSVAEQTLFAEGDKKLLFK